MKFLIPKEYGFCAGVSSAVDKALKVRDGYCLGDVVHNAQVAAKLAANGIKKVSDVDEVPDGATLIIRAHGEPPQVFERAKQKGLKVVDATCPFVRAIQQKAQQYGSRGYLVVLVGEASHPEIKGINGWCGGKAVIFDGRSPLRLPECEKALVLFQTTYDSENFENAVKNILADGVKTLEIFNTICYTTLHRQYYARLLSERSDLAVVVGDKNSSNTKRLLEIASRNCRAVLCDGSDWQNIDLKNCRNVCFVSGASTPTELIKGVFERMVENAKDTVVETVTSDEKVNAAADEQVTAQVEPKTTAEKNEQLLAQAVAEMPDKKYRAGSKVKCRVVQTTEDGVYVRLDGRKTEDFIPNEELVLEGDVQEYKKSLKENDLLECKITTIGSKGNITLSKKAIDEQNKDDVLVPGIKEGNEFSVTMTRMAKNCLTGRLGSYTVVVHASQIKMGYVKDLEKYVGKTLRLKVSGPDKVNEEKHVIFASAKAIILEEKKAKEDAFWNGIEKNEIVEGEVLRFASFGAFVNVRGFDCLAHTSDLSWDRINSPEEVLEKGKTYEFVVLDTDREHNRVSVGYKQLQPKPWEQAEEKFPVGTVVTGKVARLMPYGAFIELGSHIDGLLHVSNYDWDWIEDISKVLKVGDEVEVKVMDFDAENHRITLSRKALIEKPEHVVTRPRTTEE